MLPSWSIEEDEKQEVEAFTNAFDKRSCEGSDEDEKRLYACTMRGK